MMRLTWYKTYHLTLQIPLSGKICSPSEIPNIAAQVSNATDEKISVSRGIFNGVADA